MGSGQAKALFARNLATFKATVARSIGDDFQPNWPLPTSQIEIGALIAFPREAADWARFVSEHETTPVKVLHVFPVDLSDAANTSVFPYPYLVFSADAKDERGGGAQLGVQTPGAGMVAEFSIDFTKQAGILFVGANNSKTLLKAAAQENLVNDAEDFLSNNEAGVNLLLKRQVWDTYDVGVVTGVVKAKKAAEVISDSQTAAIKVGIRPTIPAAPEIAATGGVDFNLTSAQGQLSWVTATDVTAFYTWTPVLRPSIGTVDNPIRDVRIGGPAVRPAAAAVQLESTRGTPTDINAIEDQAWANLVEKFKNLAVEQQKSELAASEATTEAEVGTEL
eukprot:TRINITY_DN1248_c0_g2_i1.p1 TRINITY_DN1248_c0_g2~~TRINITY_DN1248_c0_g2_i1.p1  ORF type:complete len:335 (-),score=39.87 TRINITY_DN1248_c0_g2_i1:87-1091(-)